MLFPDKLQLDLYVPWLCRCFLQIIVGRVLIRDNLRIFLRNFLVFRILRLIYSGFSLGTGISGFSSGVVSCCLPIFFYRLSIESTGNPAGCFDLN